MVNYTLKKVDQAGVVEGCKQGKELFYAKSEMVRKLCFRYCESCLVNTFSELGEVDEISCRSGPAIACAIWLYRQAAGSAINL